MSASTNGVDSPGAFTSWNVYKGNFSPDEDWRHSAENGSAVVDRALSNFPSLSNGVLANRELEVETGGKDSDTSFASPGEESQILDHGLLVRPLDISAFG